VRRVPGGWREGDAILLATAGPVSLAGSEYQARWGEVSGRPPALDLAAEAALVRWLARTAPFATLAHDAAEGGLAVALAEAAIHSGLGAELDLPDDPVALFGEGGGRALVAVPPDAVEADPTGSDVQVRRIGTAGGDRLLGVPLATLRAAWEGER
jgi:phosphoribosylformylglycinamidine synthase